MNHMTSRTGARREGVLKSVSYRMYLILLVAWAGSITMSIKTSSTLSTSRIKLSATQIHVIDLLFSLPGLIIWGTILFAGMSIWHYAHGIKDAKEGPAFRYVSYGIFALLVGLIAASYLGAASGLLAQHAQNPERVKADFVIVSNYVSVVASLVTYTYLLRGSQILLSSIKKRLDLTGGLLLVLLIDFSALSVVYIWLIHGNPVRQMSSSASINPTFGLPYWATVLTVAIPTIIAWLIGALSLIGMYQYSKKTPGIVYRIVLKKLFIGIALFITVTILLQLLTQLYNLYANTTLTGLLALIAIVYFVLAYAFVLIALGARKLNTIETLTLE